MEDYKKTTQERRDIRIKNFIGTVESLNRALSFLLENSVDKSRFIALSDVNKSNYPKFSFVKRKKIVRFQKYLSNIIRQKRIPKKFFLATIILNYTSLFIAYEEVAELVKLNDFLRKEQ